MAHFTLKYPKLDQQGLPHAECSTSEDVRKVIVAMPSNKAPGYDRIPVFVIKDCLPYILPTLTALINSDKVGSSATS